jgi:hypothetical protein
MDTLHTHDPLCVPVGDMLVRHVRFRNADGVPLDLTDPHVWIEWKISAATGMHVLTKLKSDLGVAILSPHDGLVRLVLTPAETAMLAPGRYRDTAIAVLPGRVFSRSAGRIEIVPRLV